MHKVQLIEYILSFSYAGEILSLSSAVFCALAVVMMKKVGEHLSAIQFLGGGLIIGAILFASAKLQHIPINRSRLK